MSEEAKERQVNEKRKSGAKERTKMSNELNSSKGTALFEDVIQADRIQSKYQKINLNQASTQAIESSITELRQDIKAYQQIIDRKINKYYPQLRPRVEEGQKTVRGTVVTLQNEKKESQKMIEFQQIELKQIRDQQKQFDSKDNIQFAIPIQISETKKAILQLEKFIHVAKIRQKKKSEDLVKVQKTNLQQFQRTAMLRTNIEVAMLYEISLNEREMKCDETLYDFQNKIDNLNQKLKELDEVVQQKHILVSSNKHLLHLKERKMKLDKKKEEEEKKLVLTKANYEKIKNTLTKQINKIREEAREKETYERQMQEEIYLISQKNKSFLENREIAKSLNKNIAFRYADTFLKLRKEAKTNSEESAHNQSSLKLEKPNFKITPAKRIGKQYQSMIEILPSQKINSGLDKPYLVSPRKKNPESEKELKSDIRRGSIKYKIRNWSKEGNKLIDV